MIQRIQLVVGYGAGVYTPDFNIRVCKRLTDYVSVYAAELMDMIIGLRWVEKGKPLSGDLL
jgi:hypothetical protein